MFMIKTNKKDRFVTFYYFQIVVEYLLDEHLFKLN